MIDRENPLWHRYYMVPPEDKSVEQCRDHGIAHLEYGWHPQYDPRWTEEQIEAYLKGYYG
jgi:hypothetical protein